LYTNFILNSKIDHFVILRNFGYKCIASLTNYQINSMTCSKYSANGTEASAGMLQGEPLFHITFDLSSDRQIRHRLFWPNLRKLINDRYMWCLYTSDRHTGRWSDW